MFKKIIRNSLMCLIVMLSTYIISACCGPKMCEITVNFIDLDEQLGLENYTETIEAGYEVIVNIDLPVGYVYDNFSAKVGEKELNWTVKLSDPTIEPEFEYTVAKTLTVKINKVNDNHQIDIDMSGVRYKKLKVNVDRGILDNSITQDKDKRDQSNLQIVTINPDYLDNLMYLRGDAIVEQIPISVTGECYVDYNKYIIFCFTKDNERAEMPLIYSSVGRFTPENKIIEYKENKYAEYTMATKGNVPHYLYDGGSPITNSRLYYLGQIKEDIDLYKTIPNFNVEKGVTFDDKENQFVLVTNKQDYNSSLLTMGLYKPTLDMYDANNDLIDKVDNVVLSKIEKYDAQGDLKNSSIYSEYGKRYDMVSLYIGDNMATDFLLTSDEKSSLSNVLYLAIESELNIGSLDISLLSYEKQTETDYPILKLTNFTQTEKGRYVFKLDKELLEDFINIRKDDATNTNYSIGNAFLDITFSQALHTENRRTKDFTTILFPLEYTGKKGRYDNDYLVEVFVEDGEGNRDYGLIDRHTYDTDIAFFKTSQLYDWDGSEYWARNDLYITIIGPDYNDYYGPVIESIFIYKPYDVSLVGQNGIQILEPEVLNGVEKYRINLNMQLNNVNNSTYAGTQFRLEVKLNITTVNTSQFEVDFSGITFADQYNDAIYMSNDINFDSMEDFTRIDSIVANSGSVNMKFGYYKDIYYFVYSEDENLEFDLYVGQENPDTDAYEGVFDINRQITATKVLKDILGNTIRVRDNMGKWHIVYTKYQVCNIYKVEGGIHFAYNPNTEGMSQN